jgi:hypothetical protein
MASVLKRFARVLVVTGIGFAATQVSSTPYAMLLTPALAALDKWFRDTYMK